MTGKYPCHRVAGGKALASPSGEDAHSAPQAVCGAPNGTRFGRNHPATEASHPVVFATLLTAVAGFLDAAAYIELNHLFVSFMSGNSTHLGMVLASGSLLDILSVVVIVVAFVAGGGGGTWIADNTGCHTLMSVLGAEILFFLAAIALALFHRDRSALALVATAMGMQNALHQLVSGADVGKSFITGALFGLGQAIARLFRDVAEIGRASSNLLNWLAFVGVAALGTLAPGWIGLPGCLIAAAVLIAVMTATPSIGLL
jgi:uncharacterized membrane protein YoaK (UPF0700 family)